MSNTKIFILLLLTIIGCRQDLDDSLIVDSIEPGPVILVESTIYGRVINFSNEPISNAKVFIGDQSIFTDPNGVFILPQVISREKLGVIDVYHTEYFPSHTIINSFVGDTISYYIKMKSSDDIVNFKANHPINEIQVGSLNLTLEKAKFLTNEGQNYSNTVYLKGNASYDVNQVVYASHMVGLYEMQDVILNQVGQFDIYWMDDNKFNEVELVEMIPAEWEIQRAIQNGAPKEIFVWLYNRDLKRWEIEGKALRNGMKYEFELKQNGKYCLASYSKMKFLKGEIINYNYLKLPNLDLRFEFGELNNYHQIKTSSQGKFLVFLPEKESVEMIAKSQCDETIQKLDLGEINENVIWNNAFKLADENSAYEFEGVLLDCDNNGLKDGYVIVNSMNWMTQIMLPNSEGRYFNIFETCAQEDMQVQGFDFTQSTSGIPLSYRINNDVSNSVIGSCKPVWKSKFIIYDGSDHYNYNNCILTTKDRIGKDVSLFNFQSEDVRLGSIDHIVQLRNNATIGDFWTMKSTSNGTSKFEIREILSAPFIREIQDANQDWWVEMEVNNVVLYDIQKKQELRNSRLYYFAKRDF